MYTVLGSLEIGLDLTMAGYWSWVGIHHQLMRQRAWHLILIGLIIITLGDILSVVFPQEQILFNNKMPFATISLIGHLSIFLGLVSWLPVIIEFIQQKEALPQNTPLSQTETISHDSETCFRAIFEHAPLGIGIADLDNHLVEINPAYENILGYSLQEWHNLSIKEITHPDDFPEQDRLYQALKTQQRHHYQFELRLTHKSGQIRQIDYHASLVFDSHQKPTFIFSMIQDVTECRLQEKELRQTHDNLKFHLDNFPLAVIEWDENFRVQHWSWQAEHLFGWSENELLGKHFFDWPFVYDEDKRAMAKYTALLFSSEEPSQTILTRHYTKRGQIVYCEWYHSVRFDRKRPISILSFGQDVTVREQMQAALQHSEARFHAIFNDAPIGIAITDLNDYFIKVNPALTQMLGYSAQTLKKTSFLEITHPDDVQKDLALYQQLKLGQLQTYQLEKRYLCQQNRVVWTHVSMSRVNDNKGQLTFIFSMIKDITNQKQSEIALKTAYDNLTFHINNTPLAVIEWDAVGQVQRWSLRAERIFGWSADEVLGKKPFDWPFIYEEDIPKVTEVANALFIDRVPYNFCLNRNYTKSGQVLHCEWHNSNHFVNNQYVSGLSFAQDITAREQMREALQKSEKLYRMLSENTRDLIALHHIDGTYLYLSHAVKLLLGYQPEELIGKSPYTLFHPEDCKTIQLTKENSKYSPFNQVSEYRIRHKNGQYIWFETYTNPIKDNKEQIINWVTSSREVTQRKQAEETLRESKDQLQRRNYEIHQIYEFSREIGNTLTLKETLKVLYRHLYRLIPNLSCSGLILTGYYWNEVDIISRYTLSHAVQQKIPSEITQILKNLNSSLDLAENFSFHRLKEYANSDREIQNLGLTLHIPIIEHTPQNHLIKKPIWGALWLGTESSDNLTKNQLHICYTLINHLVNALKRIRAVLLQEQQHLADLVQYLPIGVVLLNNHRDIILTNRVAQKYLPIISQKPLNQVLSEPISSNLESSLKGSLLPLEIDSQLFELTAYSIDTGPYIGNYIIIIQNVTERQRMQMELEIERASFTQRIEERTSELNAMIVELAQASQHKDQFLANMSHELRTPLTAILGGSEILIDQIYGHLNPKQLKVLQTLYTCGQHLLSLINDILDLSRIEAGKIELQYESFNISQFCEACLLFIKEPAQKKQIKVHLKREPQLDNMYADPRRLKQVLVNLLNNAVKFTQVGEITLEVLQNREKEILSFQVRDTGIGIVQEDLSRLFKPFERAENKLVNHIEGTGLGLALVQRLVELHGGSIHLESQLNKGSCFTVSLPNPSYLETKEIIFEEEQPTTVPIHSQQQDGTSPLILLAEDSQTNITTYIDYLHHFQYRVNLARTGVEVLECLVQERPDLIIMDIQMPEMDGLEATRHIRAREEYNALPIIAITALAMPGDRERCLAAGVNEYLSKPVSMQELIQVINQFLSNSYKDEMT